MHTLEALRAAHERGEPPPLLPIDFAAAGAAGRDADRRRRAAPAQGSEDCARRGAAGAHAHLRGRAVSGARRDRCGGDLAAPPPHRSSRQCPVTVRVGSSRRSAPPGVAWPVRLMSSWFQLWPKPAQVFGSLDGMRVAVSGTHPTGGLGRGSLGRLGRGAGAGGECDSEAGAEKQSVQHGSHLEGHRRPQRSSRARDDTVLKLVVKAFPRVQCAAYQKGS